MVGKRDKPEDVVLKLRQVEVLQGQASTTTIIIQKPQKSVFAAFILTFFFGPLGLLYSSIVGGIILIGFSVIAFLLTVDLSLVNRAGFAGG